MCNIIKHTYNDKDKKIAYIHYEFFGDKDDDKLPELIPGWLPEGFSLTHTEASMSHHLTNTYESAYEKCFIIECDYSRTGSSIYVWDTNDDRQHFTKNIGDYEVDCYVSANDVSDYVWHDKEGKFFFTMSSNLTHDINVKIIENLKIK